MSTRRISIYLCTTLFLGTAFVGTTVQAATTTPAVEPCFAKTNISPAPADELTLAQFKVLGECRITMRTTSLDAAIARVATFKNVSPAVKESLRQTLLTTESALASIGQRLGTDTATSTARTNYASILTSVRVYLLVLPRTWVVAAADRVSVIAAQLQQVSDQLKTINDGITDAEVREKNSILLASLNASIAAAQSKASTAQSAVLPLVPDQGNTTVLKNNTAALKNALALIKKSEAPNNQCAERDLDEAIKYVAQIRANLKSSGKPNIVFILTDDLDSRSINEFPRLKSLLTDQGMTFTNNMVSLAVCCPSRATTLTGAYAHNTGIFRVSPPRGGYALFRDLGNEKLTIAVWLKNAGYNTTLVGKYQNHYGAREEGISWNVPPGWSTWAAVIFGTAADGYNYTLNVNGHPEHHFLQNCPDPERPFQCIDKIMESTYADRVAQYSNNVYTRKAVEFITQSAAEKKPFFLYLAPNIPHVPTRPAPQYEHFIYGSTTADVLWRQSHLAPQTPAYDEADVSDKPAWVQSQPRLTTSKKEYIDAHYRQRIAAMYAVEDMVDRVVQTLQETGQLDNTYIVFTSDNGYHLGEHRLVAGKNTAFDTDLRVPLIVRGPGIEPGTTATAITANVDLAPTFAELAGVSVPATVDGRSFAPLLKGQSTPWRSALLLEHDAAVTLATEAAAYAADPTNEYPDVTPEEGAPGDTDLLGPFIGIRTPQYTYIQYQNGEGEKELYDNTADPYQLTNIAASADASLLTKLRTWARDLSTCKGASCRAIEAASRI